MKTLTQKRLKELLHYDPDTGLFTRKKHTKTRGNKVGTLSKIGYITICIDREYCYAHRLAWLYVYGVKPKHTIDHINHNNSDNRIENLRDVKHKDNSRNMSMKKNNTSGVTGVWWHNQRQKWTAEIMVNNKKKYLGIYKEFDDAVDARKSAEKKYNFHTNHGK